MIDISTKSQTEADDGVCPSVCDRLCDYQETLGTKLDLTFLHKGGVFRVLRGMSEMFGSITAPKKTQTKPTAAIFLRQGTNHSHFRTRHAARRAANTKSLANPTTAFLANEQTKRREASLCTNITHPLHAF